MVFGMPISLLKFFCEKTASDVLFKMLTIKFLVVVLPALPVIPIDTVSYTHLTLPTNREV